MDFNDSDIASLMQVSTDSDTFGFDLQSGKTWVYPTNYPVREYQYNIIESCLYQNTLVSLPTGLGKTFIAAVVMYNFYRWYPTGKIIFMAPTKPLVRQQIEACYNIMAIPPEVTSEMTGAKITASRVTIWKEKRVFFITPHILQNDLETVPGLGEKIRLIVVDEAHRALGKQANCEVIRKLREINEHFRIVALSATPGSNFKNVTEVINNLLISHIECRTEESLDVVPYIFTRALNTIVVPLGGKLHQVKEKYIQILDKYTRPLIQFKVLSGNCAMITKGKILLSMRDYKENCKNRNNYNQILCNLNICITLYHGYELLIRHGLRNFLTFFESCMEKPLIRSVKGIQEILEDIRNYLGGPMPNIDSLPDGTIPEISKNTVFGHPKYYKLGEILEEHFKTVPDTRVMVFCEYRESVMEAYTMLLTRRPLIQPKIFIGKGSGVTQAQQLLVIKMFREGKCNTLVATCIGEEGIDVGEVDLIVCFDISSKSPVRMVQRMGRTGRKRDGKVVILVTEGKEQQTLQECLIQKTSMNNLLTSSHIKQHFYQNNPRMIPDGLKPSCQKMFITVPKKITKESKKDLKNQKNSVKNMFEKFEKDSSQSSSSKNFEINNFENENNFEKIPKFDKIPKSYEIWSKSKDEHTDFNPKNSILTKNLEKQRSLSQIRSNFGHSYTTETFLSILKFVDKKKYNLPTQNFAVHKNPENVTLSQKANFKQVDIRNLFKCQNGILNVKNDSVKKNDRIFDSINNYLKMSNFKIDSCQICLNLFDCTLILPPKKEPPLKHFWSLPDFSIIENLSPNNFPKVHKSKNFNETEIFKQNMSDFIKELNKSHRNKSNFEETLKFLKLSTIEDIFDSDSESHKSKSPKRSPKVQNKFGLPEGKNNILEENRSIFEKFDSDDFGSPKKINGSPEVQSNFGLSRVNNNILDENGSIFRKLDSEGLKSPKEVQKSPICSPKNEDMSPKRYFMKNESKVVKNDPNCKNWSPSVQNPKSPEKFQYIGSPKFLDSQCQSPKKTKTPPKNTKLIIDMDVSPILASGRLKSKIFPKNSSQESSTPNNPNFQKGHPKNFIPKSFNFSNFENDSKNQSMEDLFENSELKESKVQNVDEVQKAQTNLEIKKPLERENQSSLKNGQFGDSKVQKKLDLNRLQTDFEPKDHNLSLFEKSLFEESIENNFQKGNPKSILVKSPKISPRSPKKVQSPKMGLGSPKSVQSPKMGLQSPKMGHQSPNMVQVPKLGPSSPNMQCSQNSLFDEAPLNLDLDFYYENINKESPNKSNLDLKSKIDSKSICQKSIVDPKNFEICDESLFESSDEDFGLSPDQKRRKTTQSPNKLSPKSPKNSKLSPNNQNQLSFLENGINFQSSVLNSKLGTSKILKSNLDWTITSEVAQNVLNETKSSENKALEKSLNLSDFYIQKTQDEVQKIQNCVDESLFEDSESSNDDFEDYKSKNFDQNVDQRNWDLKSPKIPVKSVKSPYKSVRSPNKSTKSPNKSAKSPNKCMESPFESKINPLSSMKSPNKSAENSKSSESSVDLKQNDLGPDFDAQFSSPQKLDYKFIKSPENSKNASKTSESLKIGQISTKNESQDSNFDSDATILISSDEDVFEPPKKGNVTQNLSVNKTNSSLLSISQILNHIESKNTPGSTFRLGPKGTQNGTQKIGPPKLGTTCSQKENISQNSKKIFHKDQNKISDFFTKTHIQNGTQAQKKPILSLASKKVAPKSFSCQKNILDDLDDDIFFIDNDFKTPSVKKAPEILGSQKLNESKRLLSLNSFDTIELTSENFISPKLGSPKLGTHKLGSQKLGSQKLGSQKLSSEKLGSQKLGSPKLSSKKLGSQKLGSQKSGSEKLGSQKLGSPKLSSEKLGSSKLSFEKLGSQKLKSPELGSPKQGSQKLGSQKLVASKAHKNSKTSPKIELSPEFDDFLISTEDIVNISRTVCASEKPKDKILTLPNPNFDSDEDESLLQFSLSLKPRGLTQNKSKASQKSNFKPDTQNFDTERIANSNFEPDFNQFEMSFNQNFNTNQKNLSSKKLNVTKVESQTNFDQNDQICDITNLSQSPVIRFKKKKKRILELVDSDEDFEQSFVSQQVKNCEKSPAKWKRYNSESVIGKNKGAEKSLLIIQQKKKKKFCPFIEEEAELDSDESPMSDSEHEDDIDALESSFIHDSQLTQHDDSDIHAKYLQSVKSPVINRRGFKIPQIPARFTNVYSQVDDPNEENTYLEDSFCVDSENTLQFTENMSYLERAELELERQRKEKRKAKNFDKIKKRRRVINNSDSD